MLQDADLAGDVRALLTARENARNGFEKNMSLAPGSEEAEKQIQYANDVARILRENVLQGRPVEGKENTFREFILSL
jgi:complex III assembly factor LYRM7